MTSNSEEWDLDASEKSLIEANRAYWSKVPNITTADKNDWIYVLHTLRTSVFACVYEDIIAKGLQHKEKMPIVSVVSGKANEFLDQLDESFGMEQRIHSSYHEFDSVSEKNRIEQLAEQISISTYGDKERLLELTYRSIPFGEVVYDDILRRGRTGKRGEVFDCFDISQERYFIFIRNALAVIDKAYNMFKDRPPRYLITTEYVFTKGLYASVALALGAKVLFVPVDFPGVIIQIGPDRFPLQNVKLSEIIKCRAEHCLQEYDRNSDECDDFFVFGLSDSSKCAENPVQSRMERKKKQVFILPHAICDAPRQSCGNNLYYDYGEWLLDTLRIAQSVPDVDWIIKDHPFAACYGQCDYVRSAFEKNKAPNIHWYDKDYSGIEIKNIADCVLTCAGDAGIEYWAYGIPTITTADAYYCSWGISYQMKTLQEYEYTLKHIHDIKAPSQASVDLARAYIQSVKNRAGLKDELTKLFSRTCQEQHNTFKRDGVYFENDSWRGSLLEKVICDFCDQYTQLLKTENLQSSSIYELRYMWDL